MRNDICRERRKYFDRQWTGGSGRYGTTGLNHDTPTWRSWVVARRLRATSVAIGPWGVRRATPSAIAGWASCTWQHADCLPRDASRQHPSELSRGFNADRSGRRRNVGRRPAEDKDYHDAPRGCADGVELAAGAAAAKCALAERWDDLDVSASAAPDGAADQHTDGEGPGDPSTHLGDFGRVWRVLDSMLSRLDHMLGEFARIWQVFAELGPSVANVSTKCGPNWARPGLGSIKLGRHRPKFAHVGRHSAKF